ncbi:glycoside hydrolase family 13 protein [Ruminococcus flavefaciens]|uniref:glycoside hydrolase family 13 protein n=1 Tax=Ruminococcus flavefaciens TaxID=1265 RepID=UPI0026E9398A|nr:glycoside hydrolase family 13 protein [Ruminococcus flavefaciens]
MRPIYDTWNLGYKSVFGAVRQFETCRFTIRLPKHVIPDFSPVLVLFRTGFKERFISMNEVAEEEDCFAYTASYDARYTDVHYYYFSYTEGGIRHYIKKINVHEGGLDHGDMFQLTVYKSDYETPDFLKGGVMYQIFPDRFCNSGKPKENIPEGRILRDDWGGTPLYKPDENGHVWNNDYFGGDFAGIQSKLPYLKSLGVTCIYLNPIFESHENHRYNTANYMKADPLLGTNDEFEELCREAEKYDISIILDGVFSHTGADSVYFNKFGRYKDELGAFQSKDSKYYDWYSFIDYPNVYEAWWGIDTLPNVNENNEDYTEFICGEEGVLRYWLDKGAAGYRLDVADELPEQFLINLRKCVKGFDKDKVIIGEVWEDATNKESYGVKRRYLLGDELDSVMNYPFREAIMNFIKGGKPIDFINSVMTIVENYPKPTIDVLMNFVSTHDIERAINRLGGDDCEGKSKDWMAERYLSPEQYAHGKELLKAAMALMFFLPGIPSIYYGDEAGLQGYKDPFNRRCFPWGKEDTELIEYVSELSRVRKSIPNMIDGRIYFVINEKETHDSRLIGFTRQGRKQDYIIFVNRSGDVVKLEHMSEILSRFTDIQPFYGEFMDDAITVLPYDYTIIKAKFVK